MVVTAVTNNKLACCAILVMTALPLCVSMAAPYKWVDKAGQVHYSQVPPANQKASEVNIAISKTPAKKPATSESSDQSSNDQTRQEEIDKKQMEKIAQRRKESCTDAKHNLMVLENNNHVREKINGEYKVLSQEEREKRIARLTRQTADLCQD